MRFRPIVNWWLLVMLSAPNSPIGCRSQKPLLICITFVDEFVLFKKEMQVCVLECVCTVDTLKSMYR